jgi:hypothetical protein
MTIEPVQKTRKGRTPGAWLDSEGVQNFLAGQYRVLRLFGGVRSRGVSLGGRGFDSQRMQGACFGENRRPLG